MNIEQRSTNKLAAGSPDNPARRVGQLGEIMA
jgi:hypothetical protein